MQRRQVESSNILSVGHDPKTKTLEVEFKGGGVYQFHDVTEQEHADFIASDSLGKHFHAHIKKRSSRQVTQ